MRLLIARILASWGFDSMLYNMACNEEAEHHYMEETMNHYIVETTTGHILAEDNDKETAILKARNIEPQDTLIGTEIRPNGQQAGFFVGRLVGMGF